MLFIVPEYICIYAPYLLQQKVRNAARDLKISKITKEDYEMMSKDFEELQEALNRSQSFISTIATAVDPNKLSVSYDMICNVKLCYDIL